MLDGARQPRQPAVLEVHGQFVPARLRHQEPHLAGQVLGEGGVIGQRASRPPSHRGEPVAFAQDLLDVGPQVRDHVEGGVERHGDGLDGGEGFDEHHQFSREADVVVTEFVEEVFENLGQVDLLDRGAREGVREIGHVGAEAPFVEFVRRHVGQPGHHRDHLINIARRDGPKEPREQFHRARLDAARHAAIDEPRDDPVLAADGEEVAGVRVGVEETDLQALPGHGIGPVSHHGRAFLGRQIVGAEVGQQDALELLQGQHAPGGGPPVDGREADVGVALEGPAQRVGAASLEGEIQFPAQLSSELADHVHGAEAHRRQMRLREGSHRAEDLQVGAGDILGLGAHDLEHDGRAVGQACPVDLRDARSGQRLLVDRGEDLVGLPLELTVQHAPDLGEGEFGAGGLEFGELISPFRGDQVLAAGEHLPEFHERRAELFQRDAHAGRTGQLLHARRGSPDQPRPPLHQAVQAKRRDRVREALAHQYFEYFGVTADVTDGASDFPDFHP